jgi:hypothetical protein
MQLSEYPDFALVAQAMGLKALPLLNLHVYIIPCRKRSVKKGPGLSHMMTNNEKYLRNLRPDKD